MFPSLFDRSNRLSYIKLPRQNRVLPDEYKEFLALGHGEIFSLAIDRVVDPPWRQPFADTSNFFNYDMNESSWMQYQRKVGLNSLDNSLEFRFTFLSPTNPS